MITKPTDLDFKAAETFDAFWGRYTQCPRCKLSDTVRLAASNAWYSALAYERARRGLSDEELVKIEAMKTCDLSDWKNSRIKFLLSIIDRLNGSSDV